MYKQSTDHLRTPVTHAKVQGQLASLSERPGLKVEMHMSCGNAFPCGMVFDVVVNDKPMRRYVVAHNDLPADPDLGNLYTVDINYLLNESHC
jgi:hypothetical protein